MPLILTGRGIFMKRFFGVAVALLLATALRADYIMPRIGLDFGSTADFTNDRVTLHGDVGTGVNIGAEYLTSVGERTIVGGGFEYLFPRTLRTFDGVDTTGDQKFWFVPLYGTIRYTVNMQNPRVQPFIKGNLGYNFVYDGTADYKGVVSLTGGVYYALGFGILIQQVSSLELLYSRYAGSESATGVSIDDVYTKIGLVYGYMFDLSR